MSYKMVGKRTAIFVSMWKKMPKWLKNRYVITLIAFVLWMLFFDQNNLISQISYMRQLNKLEVEKGYFSQKLIDAKKDLKELTTNDAALEQFAREHYYMRKPNEDVFVIVPKNNDGK